MTGISMAEAAGLCCGRLEGRGGDARIARVQIDSREVRPGDLFLALRGRNQDGVRFVADALARGAVGAIVPMDAPCLPAEYEDRAQIRVKFPRMAFADLAAAHRKRLRCPVIAITGSNGKSSTREMIAKVLAPLGPVVQSLRSFNNDLGVPHTILRADETTAALVVEMGTSSRGEIAALCGVARPDIGVVTNVAPAHLEGLGTIEQVAHEKGALAAALPADGVLILNADDMRVMAMAERARTPRIATYSLSRTTATVWGHGTERTADGVATWLYGKARLELPVSGVHNASNALAATAVGLALGISAEEIAEGLRQIRLPQLRMQEQSVGDVSFLLDCYNSNPASLAAAVNELAARGGADRRVLVVGDMCELGSASAAIHERMGRRVAGQCDVLWCIGAEARALHDGALAAGAHPEQVFWSPTPEDAIAHPAVEPVPGDHVLFKASRSLRLERLADALRRRIEPAPLEEATETSVEGTSVQAPVETGRIG